MRIPYYNPGRRSVTFALVLLLALVLLVLTGLGVFRLYFDFDWTAGAGDSGQLFSLGIRGGNSFNLFASEDLGHVFWLTLLLLVLLAVLMPAFRLIGGSVLAILCAAGIVGLYWKESGALTHVPLEFELLTVGVLYAVYVLMMYFAEVRDRKQFTHLLSQYVPPELASAYSRDPDSLGLTGEERDVSVLFCDVVGFSTVVEQLDATNVTDWLNGFFNLVSRIVVRHEGTIDKYMGDSVMAVWGAPKRSKTHAYDSLQAAYDICQELADLNKRFAEQGLPQMRIGIGVSTGAATVGTFGSEYRMDYTVIGDTVNVARRLEEQTRKYHVPVIVSDKTADALPDMLFRELDTVVVKGRQQAVTMLQPMGSANGADEALLDNLELHRQAMAASKAGDWALAKKLFGELQVSWGPTNMYALYLRGIESQQGA
jgi:adenylate cyclase